MRAGSFLRPFGAARIPPIVYCVYREVAGPVFASQVVEYVHWLVKNQYPVRLVVFVPIGSFLRPRAIRAFRRVSKDTRAVLKCRVSWLPTLPSRWSSVLYDRLLLRAWLWIRYRRQRVILHCRGSYLTKLALEEKNRRSKMAVVFDCRGIAHAEYEYEMQREDANPNVVAKEIRRQYDIERECSVNADAIVCVSHSMASYIDEEFGAHPEKITVAPCSVNVEAFSISEAERRSARDRLGMGERFVVTYCGGLHSWQKPDECIRIYKLFLKLQRDSVFYAVTTQPDKMWSLLRDHSLEEDQVVVTSVPHRQVPEHLSAGDFGLVIREPSLVNKVASPVKVGEYLSVGLPVIATKGIGDMSELIESNHAGMVYQYGASDEEILADLNILITAYKASPEHLRARCRDLAVRELSGNRNFPRSGSVYVQLGTA